MGFFFGFLSKVALDLAYKAPWYCVCVFFFFTLTCLSRVSLRIPRFAFFCDLLGLLFVAFNRVYVLVGFANFRFVSLFLVFF